ncbi:MAG: hypothetical protein ACKVXR_15555 [Planctomycetota bacterium]
MPSIHKDASSQAITKATTYAHTNRRATKVNDPSHIAAGDVSDLK